MNKTQIRRMLRSTFSMLNDIHCRYYGDILFRTSLERYFRILSRQLLVLDSVETRRALNDLGKDVVKLYNIVMSAHEKYC